MINLLNSLPPFVWIILAVALYFFAYLLRNYWVIIASTLVIIIAASLLFLPAGQKLTSQAVAQEGVAERGQCLLKGIFQLAPWQTKTVCADKESRQVDLIKLNRALRCQTNQPCWPTPAPSNPAPPQ